MSVTTGTGSCLCGTVRFTANTMETHIGACHCNMCRKWASGPLMAVDCGTDVQFDGGDSIGVYNSSEWAERGFCKQCGSNLFYRMKHSGQHMMAAGLFDDSPDFTLSHQVFIDKKPDFYSFSQETTDETEAEIFAKHAPPE